MNARVFQNQSFVVESESGAEGIGERRENYQAKAGADPKTPSSASSFPHGHTLAAERSPFLPRRHCGAVTPDGQSGRPVLR